MHPPFSASELLFRLADRVDAAQDLIGGGDALFYLEHAVMPHRGHALLDSLGTDLVATESSKGAD